MSFPWSQSLPLAQRPSLVQPVFGTQEDILREESQWQAMPLDPSQSLVDDETCILDGDG